MGCRILIFDFEQVAAIGSVQDLTIAAPMQLAGAGLWAALVSSGGCAAGNDALPPARPGDLILASNRLLLRADAPCHILAVRLCGSAAAAFAAALPTDPFLARGDTCPAAAELLEHLRLTQQQAEPHRQTQSQLAYALLCELAGADASEAALPPLVAEALANIRQNYAGLYGVEELSEQLGVSKSHLVRTFRAAMGISPGRYLTAVRIDAAKRLLLHREYSLEIVASLCGFSGANYLCRVFKKETGYTPASWRALAMQTGSGLSAEEAARERALYV